MSDMNFNFNDIMEGIKEQKRFYETMYDERLKTLFEHNSQEMTRLFITKLKVYKKLISYLDSEIDGAIEMKEIIREDRDKETNFYIKGKYDTYLEIREYIDNKICKLSNMLDCIQKYHPEINDLLERELIL